MSFHMQTAMLNITIAFYSVNGWVQTDIFCYPNNLSWGTVNFITPALVIKIFLNGFRVPAILICEKVVYIFNGMLSEREDHA